MANEWDVVSSVPAPRTAASDWAVVKEEPEATVRVGAPEPIPQTQWDAALGSVFAGEAPAQPWAAQPISLDRLTPEAINADYRSMLKREGIERTATVPSFESRASAVLLDRIDQAQRNQRVADYVPEQSLAEAAARSLFRGVNQGAAAPENIVDTFSLQAAQRAIDAGPGGSYWEPDYLPAGFGGTGGRMVTVSQEEYDRAIQERDAAIASLVGNRNIVERMNEPYRQDTPSQVAWRRAASGDVVDMAIEFLTNPKVAANVVPESLAQFAPALAAGAIARNPAVTALATGGTSAGIEYSNAVLDSLAGMNVDVSNQAAVQAALNDPEIAAAVQAHIRRRLATVPIADAISGGLSGATLAPARFAERAALREGTNLAAQTAQGVALGGGGEYLGGGSPEDVFLEAVGELATTPAEVAPFAFDRLRDALPAAPEPSAQPSEPPAPQRTGLSQAISAALEGMQHQPAPEASQAAPEPAQAPQGRPVSLDEATAAIDRRIENLQRLATEGRLTPEQVRGLEEQDAAIRAELDKQRQYAEGLTPARGEMRLGEADIAALDNFRAGIRSALEAHRASQGYESQLGRLQERLGGIDSDNALAELGRSLLGIDTVPDGGVQRVPPQPAATMPREASNVRPEAEERPGQEGAQGREEVQARGQVAEEVIAPAVGATPTVPRPAATPQQPAASQEPLAPRAPDLPEIPADLTIEQARAEYAAARTDEERAAAAARIAAVRQRDTGVPATPASRTAPRTRLGSEDADVAGALGSAAEGVTLVRSAADLPADVAARVGINSAENADVEGFYDPNTGMSYVIEDALDTSLMSARDRKVWVSAHERAGHAGLRGLLTDARTPGATPGSSAALRSVLDRAANNDTISAIVESMQSQRPETGLQLVEEAIVEVAAAVETGNYQHIADRYGVEVTQAMRDTLRGYITRLVQAIKRALGFSQEVPDAEIFKLIRDSRRYARENAPRPTSPSAAPRSMFQNNASGESSASLEAINRIEEERDLGRQRMLIDRDGTVRPLFGVDAVDTFARQGQVIVQRNIGRDEWTVISSDPSMSNDLVAGKVNAARTKLDEALEDDDAVGSMAGLRKKRLEAEGVTDATEAEEEVPFSRRRTVNPYGEDQGSDLQGMPSRIRVGDRVVEFHGYLPAQEIARKYAERHGNEVPQVYAPVDEARAARIADAYDKMEHAPQDPEVKRAYRAMIDETLQQYRDILRTGLQVEFITGNDPYTNGPRDAILDVVENNHLWVYPTRSGFGTQEDFDPAGNPLLEETEFQISGQTALANDIFRVVHDYFGHIANGVGFRADGEENAWREHSAMYSPLARRAMTSETRGQNSWLNYGPHGEHNRTAKTEDTIFADQKTGLMPEWVSEDGRTDEGIVASRRGDMPPARQRVQMALQAARDAGNAEAETLIRRVDLNRRQGDYGIPNELVFAASMRDTAPARRPIRLPEGDDGHAIGLEDTWDALAFLSRGWPDLDQPVASRMKPWSAKKRQKDAVEVDAYHYSTKAGLSELDPSRAGTAAAGGERRRFGMDNFGRQGGTAARTYFYVPVNGETPRAEDVVSAAGGTHLYRTRLGNLYDLSADPRGFADEAGINIDYLEELISDAGFDGFVAGRQPGIDSRVAVVFDIGKKKIPVESVEDGVIASRSTDQTETPEFKRWFGSSRVVDADGKPLVVYHGTGSTEFDTFNGPAWFAEKKSLADQFTGGGRTAKASDSGRVVDAYVSISNPLVIDHSIGNSLTIRELMGFTGEYQDVSDIPDSNVYEKAWKHLDNPAVIAKLESLGYDGVRAVEGSSTTWLAFHPEQIKSATANRGTFDPNDASIIASRMTPAKRNAARSSLLGWLQGRGYAQGNALQKQPGGRFERLKDAADSARIILQDKMLPGLRAVEEAESSTGAVNRRAGVTGVGIDDALNFYRLENLMHGKAKDDLETAEMRHIQPAQHAMRRLGITPDMLMDVMLATHAPVRNEHIRNMTGGMQDGAAGITDAEAANILSGKIEGPFSGKKLTADQIKKANTIWEQFKAIRKLTLDNMVEAGMITDAQRTEMLKDDTYVPLRGKADLLDEFQQPRGTGRGLTVRASWIKRALGRGAGNLPQDILGEIVGDFQRSVVVKRKAEPAKALLKFALKYPMPELFEVEPVDLEWKYSESTGEVWLGVKNSAEDASRSIVVRENGNPVRIRFNDPQLRDAIMNMGVEDFGFLPKYLGAINRVRSAMLTRYSPSFAPVNVYRDLLFGMTALASERGIGAAARAAIDYLPAMFEAGRDRTRLRGGSTNKPVSQYSYADFAREASENGMRTGITRVDDVKDLQRRLNDGSMTLMQLAAQGKAWATSREAVTRALRPLAETIETINDATENALRLAAYIGERRRGISAPQAAEYAKNLTINFNRKGKAGPALNAIYLFYNASMQGTHAVARVMRNPKVAVGMAGLLGLQAYLASLMMGDPDDDGITEWDKIPDYVKRTSLVIPLGPVTGNFSDYYAVPMPYGFNVFPYIGGRMTQHMHSGRRPTDSSIPADLAKSLTEAFSPVPVDEGYRSLFGDQFAFAASLLSNEDERGFRITNETPFADYDEPRALMGKDDTARPYHVAAQLLAKAGGGDLENRVPPIGYLDVSPEQLEFIVNWIGGGVTSSLSKGARWWEQFDAGNFDGALDAIGQAPITGRFAARPNAARAVMERYYDEKGEFARRRDIIDDRIAAGEDPAAVLADMRSEYTMGLEQATYKKSGKRPDGTRYRKGEPKKGELTVLEGLPADSMKTAEKRVKAVNKAIKAVRAGKLTNEELVNMVTSFRIPAKDAPEKPVKITLSDLGLPKDYDGTAAAPTRVRTRAIKLLQDSRMMSQQDPLQRLSETRRINAVMEDSDE